jgi:hypothetical protein
MLVVIIWCYITLDLSKKQQLLERAQNDDQLHRENIQKLDAVVLGLKASIESSRAREEQVARSKITFISLFFLVS